MGCVRFARYCSKTLSRHLVSCGKIHFSITRTRNGHWFGFLDLLVFAGEILYIEHVERPLFSGMSFNVLHACQSVIFRISAIEMQEHADNNKY